MRSANRFNQQAWNENAAFWDERMGEGNDFVDLLLWPAIIRLLNPRTGLNILDIATGNGLIARRLAALGARVTAFDFSTKLIELARKRTPSSVPIIYRVIDVTNGAALQSLGTHAFDSALCNMALFDISDVLPLFKALPNLIKPNGSFVFSITHPAFNNSSAVKVVEEYDDDGKIKTIYSVKLSRYQTPSVSRGLAMRDQPRPQLCFDRPLQFYLNAGFKNGMVLDGFEERSFPVDAPQKHPTSWGGKFSEIPPVLVARMRPAW